MTNTMNHLTRCLAALCLASLMSSCAVGPLKSEPVWKAAVAGDGPGDLARVSVAALQVENLPKSARGNARQYTVFDQTYQVMDSARGFSEKGVASWYGKKFHGRQTSNGDVYDMYQLTAAHKHLPLPTFVRVTRLDNGQSIVVKVNDRGPFVGERIIDLSYAAAAAIGMLESGKAAVRIEALSSHEDAPADNQQVIAVTPAGELVTPAPLAVTPAPVIPSPVPVTQSPSAVSRSFLQIGAFSQASNAQTLQASVQKTVASEVGIYHDPESALYRVRIGPLTDRQMLRKTVDSLAMAGIDSYTLISDNP